MSTDTILKFVNATGPYKYEEYNNVIRDLIRRVDRDYGKYSIYIIKNDSLYHEQSKRYLIADEMRNRIIRKMYYNPETGLISPIKLYNKIKKDYLNIRLSDVKQFIEGQKSYQIHKNPPEKRNKNYAQVIIPSGPRKILLLDTAQISRKQPYITINGGYTDILVCKDYFSKYAWVYAVKGENRDTPGVSARAVLRHIKPIIERYGYSEVRSDSGVEFRGVVDEYLRKNDIRHITGRTYSPLGQIETLVKDMKHRIFLYMDTFNTKTWSGEVLEDLTENYNNTVHDSIGYTPLQVYKCKDGSRLCKEVHTRLLKRGEKMIKDSKIKPENLLKRGDWVRILKIRKSSSKFQKGYKEIWSSVCYVVVGVSKGNKLVQPSFKLRVINKDGTTGEAIGRRYFQKDLLKIEKGNDSLKRPGFRNRPAYGADVEYRLREDLPNRYIIDNRARVPSAASERRGARPRSRAPSHLLLDSVR
ncbi:MAG TPA: hypothetical protein VHD33_04295 [Legionellaceae bacterium]|nr:hypothetical protein [Legionellaceae bacterium]